MHATAVSKFSFLHFFLSFFVGINLHMHLGRSQNLTRFNLSFLLQDLDRYSCNHLLAAVTIVTVHVGASFVDVVPRRAPAVQFERHNVLRISRAT